MLIERIFSSKQYPDRETIPDRIFNRHHRETWSHTKAAGSRGLREGIDETVPGLVRDGVRRGAQVVRTGSRAVGARYGVYNKRDEEQLGKQKRYREQTPS